MKINRIKIELVPSSETDLSRPRTLEREPNKEWVGTNEDGKRTGLYPSEINLIHSLQELIHKNPQ